MARRSEHTQQQLKEMILQSAETIVTEEGLQALKVRKIAMDIGYTVGSIYMIFKNMDDLMMQLKSRTLDDLAIQLDAVMLNSSHETVIQALATCYLHFASQHYNRWELLFMHSLPATEATPEWYQCKVDDLFKRVERLLYELNPEQHTDKQLQQAARAIWSGIHGNCILSLNGSLDAVGVTDVEQNILLLVDCFIRGWTSA